MKLMRNDNPDRPDTLSSGLRDLIKYLNDTSPIPTKHMTMLEIGTYIGESAVIFSDHFKKVFTVDPLDINFIRESVCEDPTVTEESLLKELHSRIDPHPNIEFIRLPSLVASRIFSDHFLDFVYIDGWHRVLPVLLDITTWLPKLKHESWIGGHDYWDDGASEVIPAVQISLGGPCRTFQDHSWLQRLPV